jgi:hypothetical protein
LNISHQSPDVRYEAISLVQSDTCRLHSFNVWRSFIIVSIRLWIWDRLIRVATQGIVFDPKIWESLNIPRTFQGPKKWDPKVKHQ